jgi:hypothetical protein
MRGELCKVIDDFSTEEYEDCRSVLSGAFTKGMIVAMNEIEGVVSLEEYYNAEEDLELRELRTFVDSNDHFDVVKAAYYLNMAMDKFKLLSEEFYREDTLIKIENLKIMILVVTVIMGLLHLVEMRFTFLYLRRLYQEILILLKFLTYGKLIKDDQIKFLIRNLK